MQQALGINPQETAYGTLMFGYPRFKPLRLPERKPITAEWR